MEGQQEKIGEFQKRVEDTKWCHDFDRGGEGFSVDVEDILEIVEEAKKEFPDIGKLTNVTATPFEMKAQEWFKRWLGE